MNISLPSVQNVLGWMRTKLYLMAIEPNARNRTVKRGQVYRCNFGVGIGSEMQKERPCIIIQNDIANLNSPNTIVIPITHDSSSLPCMAPITEQKGPDGTIILDGQANTSNIVCISKARLGDFICDLPKSDLKNIETALARAISVIHYYSDMESKLQNKLNYIERLKSERNVAQDKLKSIKEICDNDNQELNVVELINSILNT